LLGGIRYTVVSASPWTDDAGAQLGTVLSVSLSSPLSVTANLPGIRFAPDGSSYSELTIPAKVSGATTLTVLVDLRSHRVVSVMPPDSTLTETPQTKNATLTAPGGQNGS
jgi:hypothetical protein